MKRGKTVITFAVGVCAGLALCGPAAQAATHLTATLSGQPIYVDGQRVSMTAYAIGGNNYVKLRDVGEAVGFNVYWDGSTVQIESGQPYTGMPPMGQSTVPQPQAPAAVTEESVQAVLASLKEQYPHFTPFPAPYRSTSGGPYYSGMNCAGWATLCFDAAFGNLPWRRVDRPVWEQIRVGDLVEYDNNLGGHVVVVTKKTADTLYYTDSGTDQKVYWGGNVPRRWLEEQPGLILYTRYPS